MSGTVSQAARAAYELAFEVSPIILTGGIANGILGNALPIIQLTGQLLAFAQGALSGGLSLNDFYAYYVPVPGGTVINNSVGMYPFANQQVAANAIIQQPNTISLRMIAPVNTAGGYLTKLAIFTSLQSSLQSHNQAGGTYSIATPAYIYTNCVMLGMTDITPPDLKQKQIQWQLDFIQPLITLSQAAAAQSSVMSKLSGGQQTSGLLSWSGIDAAGSTLGQNAVQSVGGLAGSVNTVLSSAATL